MADSRRQMASYQNEGELGLGGFSKRVSALPIYPMAELPAIKRRLIEQGGVRVNGEKVSDKSLRLGAGATYVLQVGKRKFAKVALRKVA